MSISQTAGKCFVAFVVVVVLALSAFPQADKDQERFRQAERILPILLEADSVDDPAMRALIRYECLTFIYQQKLPVIQERADTEVLKFYAELVPDKRPIRYRVNDWQNRLLVLLRKNRPEVAKQVEATYLINEDISSAELTEVGQAGNIREVVGRIMERMRRDVYVSLLSSIEEVVRRKNPAEADRLVNAAFEESERPGSTRLPILSLLWHRPPEFFESWSPYLRTRYLRLIINAVRSNTNKPDNDPVLKTAKAALNRNYDNIVRFAPEMVADAGALRMPTHQRSTPTSDSDETHRRIDTSVDKIKQAILEADSVSDNWTKYQLLSRAMTHAAQVKQFARAVEIAESARKYVEPSSTVVDWDLWMRVLPRALDHRDLDAANLIISGIKSDVQKAGALADLARLHARANRKDEAVKLVRQAYTLLEKNSSAAVPTSVIFHLVDPAFLVESGEGFDAARRSIALANRLPEPKPEERIGGSGYQTYADHVLMPLGISIGATFRWIASNDISLAAVREQDLKHRSWRLLARIAIEQKRRHLSQTN